MTDFFEKDADNIVKDTMLLVGHRLKYVCSLTNVKLDPKGEIAIDTQVGLNLKDLTQEAS